jgi:pyruvate/2-oxoglutarate dehydrogenase complex dihydrolipoamide acyltransferase (E2) component
VRHQVKLPRLGDTTQEALVTEWLCDVGAELKVGTPLMTVETDKITTDVPSPVAGKLVEQLVSPQDEVAVGAPICIVDS